MKPKSKIGIKSIFENQAKSKKSSDSKAVLQPNFSTTEKMPAMTPVTAMDDVVKGLKARPAPTLATVMAGLGGAKMPTLQSVVRDLKSGRRRPTFSALPAVPERAAVPAVPKPAAQPALRQRPALPVVPDLSAVPAVPRRFDPVIVTFDYYTDANICIKGKEKKEKKKIIIHNLINLTAGSGSAAAEEGRGAEATTPGGEHVPARPAARHHQVRGAAVAPGALRHL